MTAPSAYMGGARPSLPIPTKFAPGSLRRLHCSWQSTGGAFIVVRSSSSGTPGDEAPSQSERATAVTARGFSAIFNYDRLSSIRRLKIRRQSSPVLSSGVAVLHFWFAERSHCVARIIPENSPLSHLKCSRAMLAVEQLDGKDRDGDARRFVSSDGRTVSKRGPRRT